MGGFFAVNFRFEQQGPSSNIRSRIFMRKQPHQKWMEPQICMKNSHTRMIVTKIKKFEMIF